MPWDNWTFVGLRDPVSSLTHFAAFLLSFYVIVLFWRLERRERRRQLAVTCFGVSMMLLYGASATYHAVQLPLNALLVFQRLDHSAIYLLIAGTYTPVLYILLRPSLRMQLLLAAIWGMAFAGIASEWLFASAPYWLVVAPYVALGWMGSFVFAHIWRAVGWKGLVWVVAGGVAYTTGAVLDCFRWPSVFGKSFGSHELFHVLTMVGTLCHVIFVVKFVVPFGVPQLPAAALGGSYLANEA